MTGTMRMRAPVFELGGRIRYTHQALGLTMEVSGRSLVAHEENGSRESGFAGSLYWHPGAHGRGLSLGMGSTVGDSSGGVERLWSQWSAAEPRSGGARVRWGRA